MKRCLISLTLLLTCTLARGEETPTPKEGSLAAMEAQFAAIKKEAAAHQGKVRGEIIRVVEESIPVHDSHRAQPHFATSSLKVVFKVTEVISGPIKVGQEGQVVVAKDVHERRQGSLSVFAAQSKYFKGQSITLHYVLGISETEWGMKDAKLTYQFIVWPGK